MEMAIVIFICLLNLGISWWNCYVCGSVWEDAKYEGGFIRLLVWCGATQSAIGFSSIYLLVMLGAVTLVGGIDPNILKVVWKQAIAMWYVAIIFPLLGTGLIITIHSWMEAIRRRDFRSSTVAAYNTFAQASNMYDAYQNTGSMMGEVGEGLGSLFSGGGDSDDAKAKAVLLALVIAACALLAGILTTVMLIKKYSAQAPRVLGQRYGRQRATA